MQETLKAQHEMFSCTKIKKTNLIMIKEGQEKLKTKCVVALSFENKSSASSVWDVWLLMRPSHPSTHLTHHAASCFLSYP